MGGARLYLHYRLVILIGVALRQITRKRIRSLCGGKVKLELNCREGGYRRLNGRADERRECEDCQFCTGVLRAVSRLLGGQIVAQKAC